MRKRARRHLDLWTWVCFSVLGSSAPTPGTELGLGFCIPETETRPTAFCFWARSQTGLGKHKRTRQAQVVMRLTRVSRQHSVGGRLSGLGLRLGLRLHSGAVESSLDSCVLEQLDGLLSALLCIRLNSMSLVA